MLQPEKLAQANQILQELDVDAWLIFARETEETPERAWELLAPGMVVWQSAMLLTKKGDRIAIVGKGDDDEYRRRGWYTQVYSYVQGIGEILRETLTRLDPQQLALNYSESNPNADGLTHGMYLTLQKILQETPYVERFISADPILSRLRGRKTPEELKRIRAAIERTLILFDETTARMKIGFSEKQIAQHLHERCEEWQVGTAWPRDQCPAVNTGPHSSAGHAGPSDLQVEPGHLVHVDFGIKQNGYCSDLQRMWYVLKPGETEPPAHLVHAFNAVAKTIQEAAKILRPGIVGWEVDSLAREVITSEGYPEYQHGLGHQVGRAVHDGGTGLLPRWERYGETPYGVVEENQVYTIELGVQTDAGYLGLEEDVLVTKNGVEWLAPPQKELWLVK
ncbi:MAG: aminopeptidase P family protein [Chloroflexota bacterium]|nr:MAG: aminopeptidase P family protein [Chloroflexota bacterium]